MKEVFTTIRRGTAPDLSDKLARDPTTERITLPQELGKRYVLIVNGSGVDGVGNIDVDRVKRTFSDLPNTELVYVNPQDEPTTMETLTDYVSLIQACSTENDEVFCFVTGHGDYDDRGTYVQLGKELISAERFAQLVEPLNYLRGVLLFSNCHSEDFARRVGKNNFIGVSTSTSQEECFAIEDEGTVFTTYFLDTIAKNTERKRGLTLEQAFDTAVNRTARQLKKYNRPATRPQMYWQNNDPSKYRIV